ncbi:hypothetical protein ES702_04967 [subsurface metagenome]
MAMPKSVKSWATFGLSVLVVLAVYNFGKGYLPPQVRSFIGD